MLSEIMEDVCQPFYYEPLDLHKGVTSRKAMKVSLLVKDVYH